MDRGTRHIASRLKNTFSIENIRKELRNALWQMDGLSWIQLTMVTGIFLIFLVAPLLSITLRSFNYLGQLSIYWFEFIFSDKLYFPLSIHLTQSFPFLVLEGIRWDAIKAITFTRAGEEITIYLVQGPDMGVLLNSVFVAVSTTIFSTLLGSTLAFIFARYKFFGSEALRITLLIPLLSTPFIGAIGLKKMITADGVLNTLFYDLLHILPFKIEVTGIAAVILVQTLIFYPIVFLNAYTSLISIDPAMEEQAENMGASGFTLFRTITLPLATPGIEAGALLVFILSLEDLGTPIVFRGTRAEKVLPFQIFSRMFTPTGYISEEATALALILLSFSVIVFIAIRKYVSLRRYAMLSKGGVWRPRTRKIPLWLTVLIYLFCLMMLFFASLPHIGVTLLAFAGEWGSTLLPGFFTFNNFKAIFSDEETLKTIINSLVFSGAATTLIVLLGVSAAYLASRKKIIGMGLLDILVTIPIAIPGIVIATGLFLVFLETPLSPIYNGAPLLIISYTIRKITFTVRSVFSGLEQTDVALEEVAWNVGSSKMKTFFSITIPLISLNILAGAMLSFIYSMSEVSTGIVIGDANHETAPMTWKMYDMLFKGLAGGIFQPAAIGFILMVLQFVMIVGANLLLRRRATSLISI